MNVEWLFNGAPIPAAHRFRFFFFQFFLIEFLNFILYINFRQMFDFGYIAFDILYANSEDSGIYTIVARNNLGEAQCSVNLKVNENKVLYFDPQHPEGNFKLILFCP